MSMELTQRPQDAIILPSEAQWTDWTRDTEAADLVRRHFFGEDGTEAELEFFFAQCRRTRLDPVARQIYPVFRYDGRLKRKVMNVQVSIDGFRLIAARSGEYQGQTPTMWCGEDGEWRDIWLSKTAPSAARVGVWRRGFREPLYAVAIFDEYAQKTTSGDFMGMWGQGKPRANQIAKCAESLALRKAFPNDLSGLYTNDEMAQADNATVLAPPVSEPIQATARNVTPAPNQEPPANSGQGPNPRDQRAAAIKNWQGWFAHCYPHATKDEERIWFNRCLEQQDGYASVYTTQEFITAQSQLKKLCDADGYLRLELSRITGLVAGEIPDAKCEACIAEIYGRPDGSMAQFTIDERVDAPKRVKAAVEARKTANAATVNGATFNGVDVSDLTDPLSPEEPNK